MRALEVKVRVLSALAPGRSLAPGLLVAGMGESDMAETTLPFTAYDVSVDRDSLQAWDLGKDGMGYAVALSGPVDDRWARCYHLLRIESSCYARFHLDKEKKIVWFACRAKDRLSKLQPIINSLGTLVSSANESAESQAWDEWGERPKL